MLVIIRIEVGSFHQRSTMSHISPLWSKAAEMLKEITVEFRSRHLIHGAAKVLIVRQAAPRTID